MEQKHIDATIRSLTDEVPGQPDSCFPWLVPGNGALLKQGGDSVGDTVIYLIFHTFSFGGIDLWKNPVNPLSRVWHRAVSQKTGILAGDGKHEKRAIPDGSPL